MTKIPTQPPPPVTVPRIDTPVENQQTTSTGTTPAKKTTQATGASVTPTTDGLESPRTTPTTVPVTSEPETAATRGLQTRGPAPTNRPLSNSRPMANLPSGEPLVIKPGETLEQALEGYYRKQGNDGFTASPELVSLVREMNQIPEGAPVPDRISVWNAQGLLAFEAARGVSDKKPGPTQEGERRLSLTPRSINETMNTAIVNGSAVLTRAGDTWAGFVQREYADLNLSPEAQTLVATMLRENNGCHSAEDVPPVVIKPDLEGLALLNGEYRNSLPNSPRRPHLNEQARGVATQSGCDPEQVAPQPTAGQLYCPTTGDSLPEVTAYAYRTYLQGKTAESPEAATTELANMMAVVRDLNRGRRSPLILPSQEQMTVLVARRNDWIAAHRSGPPDATGQTGTNPAGVGPTGEGRPDHVRRHGPGFSSEQLTATMQQTLSMTEWPSAQRVASQEQTTGEIARSIYESRRFQIPWFAPLVPTYTPSLSFGPTLGTPSLFGTGSTVSPNLSLTGSSSSTFGLSGPVASPTVGGLGFSSGLTLNDPTLGVTTPAATTSGLSLGTDGLYGWPFTSVPFMGVTWSDIDAARLERLAMGGDVNESSGNLSAVELAQTQLASVAPEQKADVLARAQEIDDVVTGLRGASVSGSPVLPDGVLVADRQEGETWAQAVDRMFTGSTVDAATRARVATALESQHPDDTHVSLDPTALLIQQREYEVGSGVGAPNINTAAALSVPEPEEIPYDFQYDWQSDWDPYGDFGAYDYAGEPIDMGYRDYFSEEDQYVYVDIPVETNIEDAPYATPERTEELIYKELKRHGFDVGQFTPQQRAGIKEESRKFARDIHETRRGAVDFERSLHDRTRQLNAFLAAQDLPRVDTTTGAERARPSAGMRAPIRTGSR